MPFTLPQLAGGTATLVDQTTGEVLYEPGGGPVTFHGRTLKPNADAGPDVLTVTLPLCPTTNHLFLTAGRRRVKTKEYREWQDRAAAILARVPAWTGGYPVAIEITVVGGKGWMMGCDLANREKACVDSLVSAGILFNDSCKHVTDVRVRYEPGDKTKPSVMRVVVRGA